MKILQNITTPTGNILIVQGEKGKLEMLSLGDYGKEKNIKADFMGLSREINGVPHGDLLPLSEKWVLTVSPQYGCSMRCLFCDVPKVGPGINATFNDLIDQVKTGIALHPEIITTKRLNVHFARMGEPTYNHNILHATLYLAGMLKEKGWGFHPVVSTLMPKGNRLDNFIYEWLRIKNILNGEAGLQVSINTTDEERRKKMMPFASSLEDIGKIFARKLKQHKIIGRKITLNFALADYEIAPWKLLGHFDPDNFLIKITPMHKTLSCCENQILTNDGYDFYYPYKETEEKLKSVGYDVIVFIPSKEEDESRITCGNAILSRLEVER